MVKVLFVASEAVPFVKTGGLADVAGSLPKELRAQGVDVRVVIPKYQSIAQEYKDQMRVLKTSNVVVGWRQQYCGVEYLEYDGVPIYFIDNEQYFKRDALYGYEDDAERFAFFCRAVLDMLPQIDFIPDVIHCNDWHTGMVNVMLKTQHGQSELYQNIRTIYTIHNLRYQGVFDKAIISDVLNLDWNVYNNGSVEFFDAVNFMKGGIVYADYITTVSNAYAQEIQYAYYGENLDGLLRSRAESLSGIVNGIDYDVYNPETDQKIFVPFDIENATMKKIENKLKLQEQLGLPMRRDVPMLAIISRLVGPKGLDLVQHIMEELLMQEDIQLVVLGTGEKQYEDFFKAMAWKYPKKVSANITFNDELAHRMYAAADIFVMPSQYEPCGIGQLIALHYGTIPVVRETGGLKDTVKPYNKYTEMGNGFTFANYNAHELLFTIKRALDFYGTTNIWEGIVRNAMKCDFSWTQSAKQYKELYHRLKK